MKSLRFPIIALPLFFASAVFAATKINPFTGKPDLTGGSGASGVTESSSPTWTGSHLFRSSVTIDQVGTSGAQLTLDNDTTAQDTGILFKSNGTNEWAIKNIQTLNYLRIDSGGFTGGTTIAAFTPNGTLLGASSLPGSTLGVFGNCSIGTLYSLSGAPANGLAVEGSVGIGTLNPQTKVGISSGVLTLDGVGSGINTATNTWVNFAGTATISDLAIATNNATTAQQSLRITNAGTGDAGISFTGGAVSYGFGIDNSEASDSLTLSNGTTLGTNNIWKITTAGVQTGPNNIGVGSYVPTTVVAVGAQSAGSLTAGTRIGVDAYGTKNDSGNSANNVIGFEAIGENSGSGNAAGIRGLICQAYNHPSGGAPTFTYARGADISIYTQGAGAITTANVLHLVLDGNASGNVTTGSGVFIDSPTALGTLTNYRAINIAGTGGSNAWAVYSSTGKNYFGSNVGIGVSSQPVTKLHMSSGVFYQDGTTAYHTFAMNTTTPTTTAGQASIWAVSVGGSAEMKVVDDAGNVTQISPHNSKGDWVFDSYNVKTGKKEYYNMTWLIRALVGGLVLSLLMNFGSMFLIWRKK